MAPRKAPAVVAVAVALAFAFAVALAFAFAVALARAVAFAPALAVALGPCPSLPPINRSIPFHLRLSSGDLGRGEGEQPVCRERFGETGSKWGKGNGRGKGNGTGKGTGKGKGNGNGRGKGNGKGTATERQPHFYLGWRACDVRCTKRVRPASSGRAFPISS